MDEVIDDLISLESTFSNEGLGCMDTHITMQNNVSIITDTRAHILHTF